jgi:hypothetical protein
VRRLARLANLSNLQGGFGFDSLSGNRSLPSVDLIGFNGEVILSDDDHPGKALDDQSP